MNSSYYERLSSSNYKLTAQRRAIMDALERTRGSHLTAEDIYMEVKKVEPNIGLATVYRTLELLARLDILHKTTFDEGKYRYEFCDDDRHHHHHFICLECGQIDELEEDQLQYLEQGLENRGYQVVDHTLKIYGYCPRCRARENKAD